MGLWQEGSEITPSAWLGGAVTAVTLGSVSLLFERWVGASPVFIVFFCGCALAALCLFGAVRQYYINVGRERERGRAITPPVAPLLSVTPQSSLPTLPPAPTVSNVKLLEIRPIPLSCSVGSFVHDVGQYAPENAVGILLSFVNPAEGSVTAPAQDVVASITFRAAGQDVNVVNGWWHGGDVVRTDIPINQARELLVAAALMEGGDYRHMKKAVYAIDARRLALQEHGPSPIYTPLLKDKYHVDVTLRAGSLTLTTHEFTLTTKPFALVRGQVKD